MGNLLCVGLILRFRSIPPGVSTIPTTAYASPARDIVVFGLSARERTGLTATASGGLLVLVARDFPVGRRGARHLPEKGSLPLPCE
jgi:hypothetical protein